MINVLLLMMVSGVISPTMLPSCTRQYRGFPSHPLNVLPSKIELKPGSSLLRVSRRSLCFGSSALAGRRLGRQR